MLNVSKQLAETVMAIKALEAANQTIPAEALEMREMMERCVAAEAERDRLRQAIWPGLPKWQPSPDFPQQNFYEAVAEGFRAEKPIPSGVRELGKVAYDAYCKSSGGVSLVSGANLPEWEGLSDAIRTAWIAAAESAVGVAVLGSPDAQ